MAANKQLAIGKGGEGSWEQREEDVAGIEGQHNKEKVRIGENKMEGGCLGSIKTCLYLCPINRSYKRTFPRIESKSLEGNVPQWSNPSA